MPKNTEIEYGVSIQNPKQLLKYLQGQGFAWKHLQIDREIYKNSGKYFVKISRERSKLGEKCVFSLKEDLLAQGISEGVKVAKEIDVEVSSEQLKRLSEIIQLLGFKKENAFHKAREEFKVDDLLVTLDTYGDKSYLEVEGPSKQKVMQVVSKLPIQSAKQP